MWKLTFDAPVGRRYMTDAFHWVKAYSPDDRDDLPSLWSDEDRIFKEYEQLKGIGRSNCVGGINSVKAFEKYLKNHCSHIKDYEIVLVGKHWFLDENNKFEHTTNVTARWVDEETA